MHYNNHLLYTITWADVTRCGRNGGNNKRKRVFLLSLLTSEMFTKFVQNCVHRQSNMLDGEDGAICVHFQRCQKVQGL